MEITLCQITFIHSLYLIKFHRTNDCSERPLSVYISAKQSPPLCCDSINTTRSQGCCSVHTTPIEKYGRKHLIRVLVHCYKGHENKLIHPLQTDLFGSLWKLFRCQACVKHAASAVKKDKTQHLFMWPLPYSVHRCLL